MSELGDYSQAIRKLLPIALPLAVVGVVAGVGYSMTQPRAFEASATLYIHRVGPSAPTTVYDYDGYYSQQAAQQYTDTVVGLLKTNDLANQADRIASTSADPNQLLASINVKKIAPQLIALSVTRPTSEEAKTELVALAQAANERSLTLNDRSGRTYQVEMVAAQPIVAEASTSVALDALIGLLGGGAIGLALALSLEYLKG